MIDARRDQVLDRSYIDLAAPMGRGFMAMLSALAEDGRLRIMKRTHEGIKCSGLFRGFVVENDMINLSQETEALAQRIALAKRVPVDDAIRAALENTARAEGIALEALRPRDQSPEAVASRRARIDEIAREVAALPLLDARPTQELIDELNEL
jgi:antitoxin VapB